MNVRAANEALRGLLAVAALAGLLALSGCGGGGGGGVPVTRTADVQGLVVDDGTLGPVAGAAVAINGQNIANTDGFGGFSAQGVRAGDVTFQISAAGYTTLSEQRTLTANQNNDLRGAPFFLVPALAVGQGAVAGYLRDSTGSPAGSAAITVTPRSSPSTQFLGTSRTDGTFRVYQVPAGIGDLTAQGTIGQPGAAWAFGFNVPDRSTVNVGTLTLSNSPPPPPFP